LVRRYLRMVHATVGIRARDSRGGEADCQGRMDHPKGTEYGPMVAERLTQSQALAPKWIARSGRSGSASAGAIAASKQPRGQARSLRENQANASVRPRRMSARHCHRRISYRIGTECSGARDRPPPAGAWADWHVSQPGSGKNLSSWRRNGLIPPSGPPKVRPRVRQQHARSAASARRAKVGRKCCGTPAGIMAIAPDDRDGRSRRDRGCFRGFETLESVGVWAGSRGSPHGPVGSIAGCRRPGRTALHSASVK
jgi:hypothetical protein